MGSSEKSSPTKYPQEPEKNPCVISSCKTRDSPTVAHIALAMTCECFTPQETQCPAKNKGVGATAPPAAWQIPVLCSLGWCELTLEHQHLGQQHSQARL